MRIDNVAYAINLTAADCVRLAHFLEDYRSGGGVPGALLSLVKDYFSREGVKHPSKKSNRQSAVRAV